MRKLSALSLLWLALFWQAPVSADSLSCIQAPKRVNACPNLLYRVAQLPSMSKPGVICICATDFVSLLQQAKTDAERVQQNMTRRQLEVVYGENLQIVLDILQRRN